MWCAELEAALAPTWTSTDGKGGLGILLNRRITSVVDDVAERGIPLWYTKNLIMAIAPSANSEAQAHQVLFIFEVYRAETLIKPEIEMYMSDCVTMGSTSFCEWSEAAMSSELIANE